MERIRCDHWLARSRVRNGFARIGPKAKYKICNMPSTLLKVSLFLLIPFLLGGSVQAQTNSQKAAVDLNAAVQKSPVRITLSWSALPNTSSITVYRKNANATSWGSAIATPSASALQYADNSVTVGTAYEYRVVRVAGGVTGQGYVSSGIDIQLNAYKGKIVLLVDNAFSSSLSSELAQLTKDLRADGWAVLRSDVSRTASVVSVRNTVIGHYNSDPANVKAVYIIGHVPVPYSGNINPDGHSEHLGAWPCDGYYGEMNGTWTDNSVNNNSSQRPANSNIPGDGKFDQSTFPSSVELQVGRVDMYDMPAFAQSETELLRAYLVKAHNYKVKLWAPTQRGLIYDNLQWVANPLGASAFRSITPLVGAANTSAPNIYMGDFNTLVNGQSYLWTYASGGGLQATEGGVLTFNGGDRLGTTQGYAAMSGGGVFNMSMGSYFGDWDNKNNFLKAPIAGGSGLTSCWSGIPAWYFHHMGMGENIGLSTWYSMNNTSSQYTPLTDGWQGSVGTTHLGLMGDPSLRQKMLVPPSNLQISNASGSAAFTWTASPEAVDGYHIYRFNSNGSIAQLTTSPVTGTSYSNGAVPFTSGAEYMVRSVKLEAGASGSYFNLSLGVIATASGSAGSADCLGVVGGSALPGTACNDGDPCTTNDKWNANCQCVGTNVTPIAAITPAGSVSFCTGGSVVLNATTGAGHTYLWKRNGSNISGATASSYTATQEGSYTVSVSAGACVVVSAAVTVSVGSSAVANLTAGGPTSFCTGGSVTLSTNAVAGSSYVWKRSGTTISGASSNSYSATQAGSYTVSVSSTGCTSTSSAITVSISGPPVATLTAAGSNAFCSGGSVVLNANTGTGLTYIWKRDGAVISGATGSSYTATLEGLYTVSVSLGSCTSVSSAIRVHVGALPLGNLTANGPTTFCPGGSVTLNASTGPGYSYQWRRNGVFINGAGGSSYTATEAGSYAATVISAGCVAVTPSITVSINSGSSASLTAGGPTSFCTGGSVTLSTTAVSGATYVWKRGGTTIGGVNTNNYSATQAGSYTVSVSSSSCTATSPALAVNVSAPPAATLSAAGATTFCSGGSVVLNANTGSGLSYAWKLNGTTISGASSSSYTASAAGNYTVVVSSGGCTATSSAIAVSVNARPTASCSSNAANATVTVVPSGGVAPYTISWNTSPVKTTATASVSTSGSYTATVTDSRGCTTTCTTSITLAQSSSCAGTRTESQNTWGATASGSNPAAYMTSNFNSAFPGSNYLTIGCGWRKMRLTSAAAVINFLPSSGSASQLPWGTKENPGSSYGNSFAGELVALKLSVRFDELAPAFNPSPVLLKNMVIANGMFAGQTVAQLIASADAKIGGCYSGYSRGDLHIAIAAVNTGYLAGTMDSGYLVCPGPGKMVVPMAADEFILDDEPMVVTVFPNPANDVATLVINGTEQGSATTVAFYSLSGMQVSSMQVAEGENGVEQRVALDVSMLAPGIYFYKVVSGDRSAAGRIAVE